MVSITTESSTSLKSSCTWSSLGRRSGRGGGRPAGPTAGAAEQEPEGERAKALRRSASSSILPALHSHPAAPRLAEVDVPARPVLSLDAETDVPALGQLLEQLGAPSGPLTGWPLISVIVSPFCSPACSNRLPGLIALTCTPTICPPSYFGRIRAWENRADGFVARFCTSLRSTAKRFWARRSRLLRACGRVRCAVGPGAGAETSPSRASSSRRPAVLEHDAPALDLEDPRAALDLLFEPHHEVLLRLEILDGGPGQRPIGRCGGPEQPQRQLGLLVLVFLGSDGVGLSVETLKRLRVSTIWRSARSRGEGAAAAARDPPRRQQVPASRR